VSNAGRDPMFEGWDRLDWQERRERRIERWQSARGIEFVNDSARQEYKERIQLLVDAITLKKPARVPVSANVGFYVGKHSGLTKKEAMCDYQKSAAALIKYHEDFRPDFQARPVAPAKRVRAAWAAVRRLAGRPSRGRNALAVRRGRVHEAG
jgi:hypothetical protein